MNRTMQKNRRRTSVSEGEEEHSESRGGGKRGEECEEEEKKGIQAGRADLVKKSKPSCLFFPPSPCAS